MGKRIHDKPQQPENKPASLTGLTQPQHAHQGKQCPKCNYVRKPSDSAPEWQCPACEVAYYKVSAEYEAHLQQEQIGSSMELRKKTEKRKQKRAMDLAGFAMLFGLTLALSGIKCGCGVTPPPNLWMLGSGVIAMLGGFVYWLGDKVAHLHRKNKDPENKPH